MAKKVRLSKRSEELARQESKKVAIRTAGGPWTGIKFPEGSQKIAFMAYVHCGGNLSATVRELKKTKAIPGGRVPTYRTLYLWSVDNHWDVLRNMVDDGLMDFLDAQQDPDIKNAIREDATLFKFLESLRSTIYVKMAAKNSPLMPRNTSDAVRLLHHVQESMDKYRERGSSSTERRQAAFNPGSPQPRDESIVSITQYLSNKGQPITQETVAREILHRREGSS